MNKKSYVAVRCWYNTPMEVITNPSPHFDSTLDAALYFSNKEAPVRGFGASVQLFELVKVELVQHQGFGEPSPDQEKEKSDESGSDT